MSFFTYAHRWPWQQALLTTQEAEEKGYEMGNQQSPQQSASEDS